MAAQIIAIDAARRLRQDHGRRAVDIPPPWLGAK